MSSNESFDLVVIGCGPAGEKAGPQAAYFGKRVAIIERAPHLGGSCINTGTVPSKTLRESALYFSGLKQRGLYGIDYSLKENLTVYDFMHHEREVVRALYENNARGHITGDTAGMLKLIFARADKKLLGVSMISENATELIHIGPTVLDKGLTIDEFIEQVFNYPTLSEAYKYAAYDGLGNLAGHKLREG